MPGPQRVKIDDLEIDATPEQDYTGDVETTEHPVAEGADPTDHARVKPETFVATCVVSSILSVTQDTNQNPELSSFERSATGGYARSIYNRVKRMKDDRKLHTITTPLRKYENMMLVSLSAPTRPSYGDGVVFKVGFKEIRLVNSGTAQLARPASTGLNKPTKKEQQAKKQGTQADQYRSGLKTFTDSIGQTMAGSGVAP